jgi:hypothetical protein
MHRKSDYAPWQRPVSMTISWGSSCLISRFGAPSATMSGTVWPQEEEMGSTDLEKVGTLTGSPARRRR